VSVRVVVLAMLSGLLALTAVAPAQASFHGHNGRIAYAPPIFGLDTHAFGTVDLSNRWVSISTGAVDLPSNIAWSANGKRFAFDAPATSSGAKRAIYIGNADGSGIRQVGAGNRLRYNPAWSPDGTKLAFVQDNGSAGSGDIYTMTTTGTSLTRLTTGTAWEGQPDWAPDGTRIAYTCVSGGRRQLCQMTPKGGSKTVTTGSLGLPAVIALSWSPTSLSLVFSTADSSGLQRIYRMSRSGGSPRMLVVQDGVWGPTWSPDGTRIAFERDAHNGALEIVHVSALDGSDLRHLGGGENNIRVDPSGWQPLP
jgi:Tol biopolymer transport system component